MGRQGSGISHSVPSSEERVGREMRAPSLPQNELSDWCLKKPMDCSVINYDFHKSFQFTWKKMSRHSGIKGFFFFFFRLYGQSERIGWLAPEPHHTPLLRRSLCVCSKWVKNHQGLGLWPGMSRWACLPSFLQGTHPLSKWKRILLGHQPESWKPSFFSSNNNSQRVKQSV